MRGHADCIFAKCNVRTFEESPRESSKRAWPSCFDAAKIYLRRVRRSNSRVVSKILGWCEKIVAFVKKKNIHEIVQFRRFNDFCK